MKKLTTLILSSALLSSAALADGGYLWEQKLNQQQDDMQMIEQLSKDMPTAAGSGYSAVEYKRRMIDDDNRYDSGYPHNHKYQQMNSQSEEKTYKLYGPEH